MKFMENTGDKPFFAYIPTNAPHGPFFVDEKYSEPYIELEGSKIVNANFYGMLVNIDENFGRLEKFLKDRKLMKNTIVIFMTDNGSGGGVSQDGKLGHNNGLRGKKGDKTEGGHRVPFFIRWPDGKIKGGKDINELSAHVDMLPTLAGLCNLTLPERLELDGEDFSPLLLQEEDKLEDRTMFVHNRQDWRPPMDVNQTCIMTNRWRLVNGTELFEIEKDRHQDNNLAQRYPEVVGKLLNDNEKFLKRARANPEYNEFPVFVIGNEKQEEVKLTIQHAIGEGDGIWKAQHVASGLKNKNNTHALQVEQDGIYLISCRRWPKECPGPVQGIPEKNPKNMYTYHSIKPDKVRIQIANQILEKSIRPEDEDVSFEVKLEKGKTFLITDFIKGKDKYGVYYTYISYAGKKNNSHHEKSLGFHH
jgi:hypothetical protein